MNTTHNAIDANFSQNHFVKLGQLLAVLTVAQKNETRSMKSHNQNAVRDEILKKLDARAVLMVMDWAMKFLARKFSESQSDWFLPEVNSVYVRDVSGTFNNTHR